jgi:D-alanine-D-alanine ligase-like ATP-grasp enzyme
MGDNESLPPLLRLLEEIAPEYGARIAYEPKYGYAGYIEFPNRKRKFFRGTSFDVNPQGASTIAKDKEYCIFFLRQSGYSVPAGILLFSPKFRAEMFDRNPDVAMTLGCAQDAMDFVREHGFPVYVKPNEGSEGRGVSKVSDYDRLFDAVYELFPENPKVLLQECCAGRDFRVVVLEDEVVSAYERIPLHVVGDGKRTILSLLRDKLRRLREDGGGGRIGPFDRRIETELASRDLSYDAVLGPNLTVQLLANANLSTGGECVERTGEISGYFRDICVSAAKDLGLTLAGVDMITEDISGTNAEYRIIEMNSAPGLNIFARLDKRRAEIIKRLYERVFDRLSRDA